MIKGPSLVVLNFSTGRASRYVRMKSMSVAGLGWELRCTHRAEFDPKAGLDLPTVDTFRVTGA